MFETSIALKYTTSTGGDWVLHDLGELSRYSFVGDESIKALV